MMIRKIKFRKVLFLFRYFKFNFIPWLLSNLFTIRFMSYIINFKIKNNYFYFNGKILHYFIHSYNNFPLTVRSIEIPIVKYLLDINKDSVNRVLEIGNVTNHYYNEFKEYSFKIKDTVDKYETAYDVINADIADHCSDMKYNLIFSISTFEHMDSDGGRNLEYSKLSNDNFSTNAFINMNYVVNDLLEKKGIFIITFPLGYTSAEIDASLCKKEYKKLNAQKVLIYIFKRKKELKWVQVPTDSVLSSGNKFNWNNESYLCIMEIHK